MNVPGAGLRLLRGSERAMVLSLLGRAWSLCAGLLSIWLISRYLTAEAQGYFFTLTSMIAVQALAELGLQQAIVHVASHEMARLQWSRDRLLVGDARAKTRLQSLLRFSLGWFAAAGALLVLLLMPVGSWLLARGGDGSRVANLAWVWLVLLAAANLLTGAALALLEGCGRVADIAGARLAQGVLSSACLWVALVAGWGMWALVVQSAIMLLASLGWLVARHHRFMRDMLPRPPSGAAVIAWRSEMWPFQWRIAVSWASGFFIAQLFTPLLFATRGPVPAGKMGLTMQVFGALNMLAMVWITTQLPRYGQMIARGEGRALDHLFLRALRRSSSLLVAALLALLAAAWLLAATGSPLEQRLLPWPLLLPMCMACLANHVIFAEAALLRSHKADPFMTVSVASGVTTTVLAFAWTPEYGLAGAVAAYTAATLLVGLVGGSWVFLRARKAWWMAAPTGTGRQ